MKSIEPPQFLVDIYRDLRDRHLLLPALGLIVGLIAVPFLLKGPDAPAPAPPVAQAGGHQSAVTAAVLVDDSVDVRNYRKRLDDLKSKNPFEPAFEPPPSKDDNAATDTGDTETAATDPPPAAAPDTGAVPADTAPPVDTSTTDVTVDQGNDGSGDQGNGNGGNGNGPNSGNGNGGNEPSTGDVEVVEHLVTRRVDLVIGLQGDPKLHENVKPMTILPDEITPVVAYLGTDEQGTRAAFVVANDATLAGGTAACVPAPENCLYITLEKNETATLSFGPDGQTYELRLLEIRDVELPAE